MINTKETKINLSKTGIYYILCLENNKMYIGSASSTKAKSITKRGFYSRLYDHSRKLKLNKHRNKYLQNAYNKYGKDSFIFNIIEFCDPEECEEKELYYMNFFESYISKKGFNIILQSLSLTNYNFSEDHRLKISKSLLGRERPLELRKKLGTTVIQYDLNGNYVEEFYSMSEASRKTGIQRQDIGQSIIGKKCKTAGGFIWKIKEKDEDIV